jgi:hypothetical protein
MMGNQKAIIGSRFNHQVGCLKAVRFLSFNTM